ncbi:hypothetical protein [Aeromonas hydrophila]|uniref:hypothetical protein n=1 Tax=Aeromonas hydrophila TaxID=644 RepID=UPI000B0E88AF|nr:hypothetical protein [Aeromonas hydrophila]
MSVQLALSILRGSIDYFIDKIEQDDYQSVITIGLGLEDNPRVVDYYVEKVANLAILIEKSVLKDNFFLKN